MRVIIGGWRKIYGWRLLKSISRIARDIIHIRWLLSSRNTRTFTFGSASLNDSQTISVSWFLLCCWSSLDFACTFLIFSFHHFCVTTSAWVAKLNHRQRRENRLNFTPDNFEVRAACAENDKGEVKVINDNVETKSSLCVVGAFHFHPSSFGTLQLKTNGIDFRIFSFMHCKTTLMDT